MTIKESRQTLRKEYAEWNHMKKGSSTSISGASPTREQIDIQLSKLQIEETQMTRIVDSCNLLTGHIRQEILKIEKEHENVKE